MLLRVLILLFLPDYSRVKLTGVEVDETKSNGDGKLSCHAQNDGQNFNVLWKTRKKETSKTSVRQYFVQYSLIA